MKCEYCGKEIEYGKIYCSNCGNEARFIPDYNELEDELTNIVARDTDKKSEDDSADISKDTVTSNYHYSKGSFKLRLILIISIGIVVIGLSAFAFYRYIENKNAEEQYNSYEYQFSAGKDSMNQEDYESAEQFFKRALELKDNSTEAMLALADVYLSENDETDYLSELYKAIDYSTDKKSIYQKLIKFYDEKGDYDSIINLCNNIGDHNLLYLFSDYIVTKPTLSSSGGNYTSSFKLYLYTSSENDIYYTLDGKDPKESGILYENYISIEEGETKLRCVAKNWKGVYSNEVEANYTVEYKNLEAPVSSLPSGEYPNGGEILLTEDEGIKIYYTWDGSEPNEYSPQYTTPLQVPDGENVLKCIGISSDGRRTPVAEYYYIKNPQ